MVTKIVLAYCIVQGKTEIQIPDAGIDGAPVLVIDVGTLRCFVSQFTTSIRVEPVPEMLTAFNRVLQQVFSQAAIIPFRFPTIVESEDVLREFIADRTDEYDRALRRLHNKVQMDFRIDLNREFAPPRSGLEYLKRRRSLHEEAQIALEKFKFVSESVTEGWIERQMPSGIRGFALLDRSQLPTFLEKIAMVRVCDVISARVTGPWPPSEFVEFSNE